MCLIECVEASHTRWPTWWRIAPIGQCCSSYLHKYVQVPPLGAVFALTCGITRLCYALPTQMLALSFCLRHWFSINLLREWGNWFFSLFTSMFSHNGTWLGHHHVTTFCSLVVVVVLIIDVIAMTQIQSIHRLVVYLYRPYASRLPVVIVWACVRCCYCLLLIVIWYCRYNKLIRSRYTWRHWKWVQVKATTCR